MTQVRGDAGELVQRLIDVIKGLPERDAIDACAYIAIVIGGEAMTKTPRRADVIPEAGTVGAELFIEGSTVEMDPYLELLAARMGALTASGVREDFLIRSVIAEVTRQLTRRADIEKGNASRAELLARLEASGVEIAESFRDRVRPLTQADADALAADLGPVGDRLRRVASRVGPGRVDAPEHQGVIADLRLTR